MGGYKRWRDIRAVHVARAGGEEAVREGREELLAEVTGERLAELRRARGLTQQDVADPMTRSADRRTAGYPQPPAREQARPGAMPQGRGELRTRQVPAREQARPGGEP